MRAIIIHGRCSSRKSWAAAPDAQSNRHWLPWLQWELSKRGVDAQTPEMPSPYLPDMDYDEWAKTFKQFNPGADTILIGHSNGAGFLLKYLSLNPRACAYQLVLVAPYIDPAGEHPTFHKDYEMDAALPSRVRRIDLFHSMDDKDAIQKSVRKILDVYGGKINCRWLQGKGHFTEDDMGTREFPELLEAIKLRGR